MSGNKSLFLIDDFPFCFSQVSELPMVLRAMIDFDQNGAGVGGGVSLMNPVDQFSSRFRSRLHNKGGMLLQPPSPNPSEYISSSSPRSTYGIGELNRRITDLKVDQSALSPPHNFMRDSSPKLLELGQNYSPHNHYQPTTTLQYNQQLNQQIRRDSNNSTTSSSYYSMKSCDVSRRSSNQSHTSSVSTIRPSNVAANYQNYDPNYFYDPISAGSSRRSSQLSTADGNANNINYGPPSSQLLSSHLARLQQRHSMSSAATNSTLTSQHYNSAAAVSAAFYQQHPQFHSFNPYTNAAGNSQAGNFSGLQQHQNQNMFCHYPMPNSQNFPSHMYNHSNNNNNAGIAQMPTSSTDRRMSEPISSNASRNVQNDFPRSIQIQRPRSTTPTKSLEMLLEAKKDQQKKKPKQEKPDDKGSPSKPHPNETVVLDVLKTNEKIENCDELVIPDDMVQFITNHEVGDENVKPKIKLDLDEIEPMSSSISIEKIKEEDLFTLLAEVDVKANESAVEDNNEEFSSTSVSLPPTSRHNDINNEINNNGTNNNNNNNDDCKIESDTSSVHQQITCKS
jgi:hypothetical protein